MPTQSNSKQNTLAEALLSRAVAYWTKRDLSPSYPVKESALCLIRNGLKAMSLEGVSFASAKRLIRAARYCVGREMQIQASNAR